MLLIMNDGKVVEFDDSNVMKTPYFDKENKLFEPLINFPHEQLSKDINNYIYRPAADYFGQDIPNPYPGILDILIAPIYTVPSKNKVSIDYSTTLTDHFFELFPDPKKYGSIINKFLSDAEEIIFNALKYFPEKSKILIFIDENPKTITNIRSKLTKLINSPTQAAYVGEAILLSIRILQTWSSLKDQVTLIDDFELENSYFSLRPYQSDIKNPLRFFTHIVGRKGYDKLFTKYNLEYGNTEGIAKFIQFLDDNYRRETRNSWRLIEEKLRKADAKGKRKIKLEIITSLIALVSSSREHDIAQIYTNHLLPYKFLASQLIKKYPKSKLDDKIKFDYKLRKIFEREEFLDELMNIKIKGKYGVLISLSDINTRRETIELLLNGHLKEITEPIRIPWEKQAFRYLLQRLRAEKFKIIIAELVKCIFFTIDNKPISATSISKYNSANFSAHRSAGKFPEIDALFG
jgi:hypothetical protein